MAVWRFAEQLTIAIKAMMGRNLNVFIVLIIICLFDNLDIIIVIIHTNFIPKSIFSSTIFELL